MRRRWLAAILTALMLAVVPIGWSARADGERTLVDLTVETVPHIDGGHCFETSAGHLTVIVHAVGTGSWPVRYTLSPWGNAAEGERVNTLVATQPTTNTIAVQDGLYCYALSNEAVPLTQRLYPDEVYRYAQDIAFKMTWTP